MNAGGWFRLGGRASRREAWAWFGVHALSVASLMALERSGMPPGSAAETAAFAALGLTFVGFATALVRRYQDAGLPGWWAMAGALPVVGLVAVVYGLLARPRPDAGRWTHGAVRSLALLAILAIGLLAASRSFWAPYWISAGAMKPTLLVGDYVYVAKLRGEAPSRGDVVVFRHPATGQDHIMRLIGLPGDSVQMIGGILHLNGDAVPTAPAGTFSEVLQRQGPAGGLPRCENAPVALGGTCTKSRLRETLPDGAAHAVLNIDTGFLDDTAVFAVPVGHYFVMGDNRDNSMDSRVPRRAGGVGFVPAENLIGRAERIMFSAAGGSLYFVWTWRADRFLRAVE